MNIKNNDFCKYFIAGFIVFYYKGFFSTGNAAWHYTLYSKTYKHLSGTRR